MNKFFVLLLKLLGILLLTACRSNHSSAGRYELLCFSDSLYYLTYVTDSTADRWKLPYPVYRFETGDIDGDGSQNALVGVIKTTRFDPKMHRRLFIFKTFRGHVRPLWLGSRLGQPLEDFRFVTTADEPRIRSMECEQSGNYLIAEYRWRSFGLEFVTYRGRELSRNEALAFLHRNE
ncbi:hypothetical protein [Tannerella sp.]|uniref:hypothetical protein n=1 Tax=Tannerella sp. TaxID=2382127 RepID=UPI0026DB91EF|nr:hypothetical protein [Tannerella sp.]MDO4703592.1 hypothetical protein [Tannerella sp.]